MTLKIYQKEGFFLSFKENEINKEFNHIFCGQNKVHGALCPNCNKPLLKYLSIDTRDDIVKNNFGDIKYLHFLFCWTCNIAQGDFVYQIIPPNEIRILNYKKGGLVLDFPYEDYPLFFPERKVGFKQIDEIYQQLIVDINREKKDIYDYIEEYPDIGAVKHQVGGEPMLIQRDIAKLKCQICREDMPLLASIGDRHPDNISFTRNEFVQILYFYCKKCSVIGVRQFCD